MDIVFYDKILEDLQEKCKIYDNTIVPYPSNQPTYPYTVFEEIRNVVNERYNTCFDRVSSMGYRVDVFAKSKSNEENKQKIARAIAKEIDNCLTNYWGLSQISWNVIELENDSSIYHIVITYSCNLHENRRRII